MALRVTKDKRVLYIVTAIIFVSLLVSLFVGEGVSRVATAIMLIPLTAITCLLIKKRAIYSVSKREVLLLMAVMGVIYIVLNHMSGIWFGYGKALSFRSTQVLLKYVLPITAIIIAMEMIRSVLLAQKDKIVSVVCYLSCVIADVLMYSSLQGITSFNKFMDLMGLTLLPAVTANFLYHYLSKRYGCLPGMVYRLLTTLYVYFIPTAPLMNDALSSVIKILVPVGLLLLLSALFDKKERVARKKPSKWSYVGTAFAVVVMISIAMLISCQFRFGALVIATESMTGEINKGDMIIYDSYRDQGIREGQVIVFQRNKSRIVHRVVEIKNIDGEVRYYTKGDANEDRDAGYVLSSDIVGLTDLKVAYVGYPTLWLREVISNQGKGG